MNCCMASLAKNDCHGEPGNSGLCQQRRNLSFQLRFQASWKSAINRARCVIRSGTCRQGKETETRSGTAALLQKGAPPHDARALMVAFDHANPLVGSSLIRARVYQPTGKIVGAALPRSGPESTSNRIV